MLVARLAADEDVDGEVPIVQNTSGPGVIKESFLGFDVRDPRALLGEPGEPVGVLPALLEAELWPSTSVGVAKVGPLAGVGVWDGSGV